MELVTAAETAVFLVLDAAGMHSPILGGRVVSTAALLALERDLFSGHDRLRK